LAGNADEHKKGQREHSPYIPNLRGNHSENGDGKGNNSEWQRFSPPNKREKKYGKNWLEMHQNLDFWAQFSTRKRRLRITKKSDCMQDSAKTELQLILAKYNNDSEKRKRKK
tara:strand:- start:185 stop:520 length:336 start_codon:yes stop_codon:yes gene_type:complete